MFRTNVLPFALYKRQIEMDRRIKKPKISKRVSIEDCPASSRDETLIKKSVYLPNYVWVAVEREARRQKRNVPSQIEYFICEWLGLYDDEPEIEATISDKSESNSEQQAA